MKFDKGSFKKDDLDGKMRLLVKLVKTVEIIYEFDATLF